MSLMQGVRVSKEELYARLRRVEPSRDDACDVEATLGSPLSEVHGRRNDHVEASST